MKRHPIRRKAVLALIVSAVAGIALELGVSAEVIDQWLRIAGHVMTVLVALGIVVTAEHDTTPTFDPRSAAGLPLAELHPPAPHGDRDEKI